MADGNIQAARKTLGIAVQRLTGPRMGVYHDTTMYAPSLYAALASDLAGTQGDSRTPAKSLPPLWIDAMQLLASIDIKTHFWCPMPGSTPRRLQLLSFRTWRPQDTQHVEDMARIVEGWCESIIHLLDPEAVKFLSVPCPECGRKTVYRKDSAGETVRQPALKLIANQGCTCQHCKTHWPPEMYLFLSRLIGLDAPAGVVGS